MVRQPVVASAARTICNRLANREDADASQLRHGNGHIYARDSLHGGAHKRRPYTQIAFTLPTEFRFQRYVLNPPVRWRIARQEPKFL
jgi:hypothetical protein